jgi:hypothetical protein
VSWWDVRSLDYALKALTCAVCCLVLAACNDGSPSAGAPPGQGAPGAPAGNGGGGNGGGGNGGGGNGGKHVPVAPDRIPNVVINAGQTYSNLDEWHALEQGFWDACPGGSHCVTPVFVLVDALETGYPGCAMVDLEVGGVKITEVGTPVPMGSRIVVNIKRPCPGLEGDGSGSESPVESPPVESPDASDQPNTP